MRLVFTPAAWEDDLWLQDHDRKLLKRANQLLRDIRAEMAIMEREDSDFEQQKLTKTKLGDLGLTIEGTPLEPIVGEFQREVRERGIGVTPHVYLTTEWGVPFPSISIGVPFYLAHPELVELHGELVGHFEGVGRRELLKYLRHEMGHVVNYAWKLYDDEDWVTLFGSMTQPYLEDYRPEPFSRRYVNHLPGWYAQKHPDEDWAETFAVWMAPGEGWKTEYRAWPEALAKLEYCEQTMARLASVEPFLSNEDHDEHVATLPYSAEEYYANFAAEADEFPEGLAGALRSIFENLGEPEHATLAERLRASDLMRRLRIELASDVFRWTGHFPEKTHALLRHLGGLADELQQVYPSDRETQATVALTTLVTALAMNHVRHGSYLP